MIRRPKKRMTLAGLKRHMDRRFDRLERTKADKADVRRFATKRYLQQHFATKDDLKRFATKDDFARCATRDDLARLEGTVDARFGEVARQLDSLNAKIDSVLAFARGKTSTRSWTQNSGGRRPGPTNSTAPPGLGAS